MTEAIGTGRDVFRSRFALGDKVTIDGDLTIKATAIGFAFYGHQSMVLCAWFASGAHQEVWINEFRLAEVA